MGLRYEELSSSSSWQLHIGKRRTEWMNIDLPVDFRIPPEAERGEIADPTRRVFDGRCEESSFSPTVAAILILG